MRKVKVLKSAETSGMAAAVLGRMRAGLAKNSYSSGASNMALLTMFEYKSVTCAGSKLDSATKKA